MAKHRREVEGPDGWSRWVTPVMSGYKMGCCDCGLVHDLQFEVVEVLRYLPNGTFEHEEALDPEKYRVLFRARRNNRSTSAVRRKPHAR
jgi:hypothetical protein